jgi:hypothetical protein
VDDVHAKLGTQLRKNLTGTTIDSDAFSASYAPFVKAEVQPLPWVRFTGGVRGEVFTFDVNNRCAICVEQSAGQKSSGIILPKMPMGRDGILHQLWRGLSQQRCAVRRKARVFSDIAFRQL